MRRTSCESPWVQTTRPPPRSATHTGVRAALPSRRFVSSKMYRACANPDKEKLFVKVVLADPRVLLEPGEDSIGIDLQVTIDAPALEPRTGRLAARGRISYDAEKKAFFLRDPSIERIDLGSLKPEHADKVGRAIETVARGALEVFPVYSFEGRNLEELTAAHVLRDVAVRDGKLVAKLGLP